MKTTIQARIAGKVRKTSTLKFRSSRKSNHQSFGIDARVFTQKSARKGSVLKIIHDSFERRKRVYNCKEFLMRIIKTHKVYN